MPIKPATPVEQLINLSKALIERVEEWAPLDEEDKQLIAETQDAITTVQRWLTRFNL